MMDRNQQTGPVSKQQADSVEPPNKSTSISSVDGGGGSYGDDTGSMSAISAVGGGGDSYRDDAGSMSTISAVGGGGGGSGSRGVRADSVMAPPSEEQARKIGTVSSKTGGRIGKGGALDSGHRPYLPLHGLISFVSDLHMKTPQEILEKVRPVLVLR